MAGMFRGIGRRLMGALSITGSFKTRDAAAISDTLVGIEQGLRETTVVADDVAEGYKPNRAERSLARRRNRFRCSRNKAFHTKRGNQIDADGNLVAQARLTHENIVNKGIHLMYNPKLMGLLYSSGALGELNTEARVAHV